MASDKHQLLKTTKNISKRTDVNILDSCCQFVKQRKYQTSNINKVYWQDKSYVKKHSQRRKMHISKRKKANLLWKRKIVKIRDDSRNDRLLRSLNTTLEKCSLSKSMHCDHDEANTRCKDLVKYKEQILKNKVLLNTSGGPEAVQLKGTDMLNSSNKNKLCEQSQLLNPAIMSNQNSTSTDNKCQSSIQQVRQLKIPDGKFHSKPLSKHKNELTLLQCEDVTAVDNRLQHLNHPKVFSKPRSNISVSEFNRSDPLINLQNISKSTSNQFTVINPTKRSESSANHIQISESLVNHLKRSESSVVNLNRAKSLVNQLGGPKSLVKKIERPNTSVSKIFEPNTSVSKLSGPNTSVSKQSGPNTSFSKLCGPNTSVRKLCGPNTSVSKLSGPNTSVSKLCGPNTSISNLSGPNTLVKKLCKPNTSVNLKESAVYTSINEKSPVRQLEELKSWLNPCNSFKDSVIENNQSNPTANPRVQIQSASEKSQPLLGKAITTQQISDVKEIEKKTTSLQKSLKMKDVFSRLCVSHSKCIGDISHLCCQLLKDVTKSSQICTFNINDIKRLWNLNKRFNTKYSNKVVNHGADSKKPDYCLKKKKPIDFEDASDNRGVIACIQMILKKQSITLQAIDNVLQILQVPVQAIPDAISNKLALREQQKHVKQNLFSVKHNERHIQKLNPSTSGNITLTFSKSLRTQQCNVQVSY